MSASLAIRTTRWMAPLLVALACLAGSRDARAEEKFPSRPVRIIVPFAAGGVGDLVGRALAAALTEQLGQPVIVENRPGADAAIGTEAVVRAAPDGYTILQVTSTQVINQALKKNITTYDLLRDLTPLARLSYAALVLVSPSSAPFRTVPELVAYAKTRPAGLTYGSGAVGSVGHLSCELFKAATGVTAVNVVYKGNGALMPDLLGGRLDFTFPTEAEIIQSVRSGTLRALAVTAPKRMPDLPEVPTMIELGFKGFEPVVNWGYMVPLHTPAPIVRRLHEAFAKAAVAPAVLERLKAIGVTSNPGTAEDLTATIKADLARWTKVIQDAGIHAE